MIFTKGQAFRKALENFVEEASKPGHRRVEGPGEPFTEKLSALLSYARESILGFKIDNYGIDLKHDSYVASVDYENKTLTISSKD